MHSYKRFALNAGHAWSVFLIIVLMAAGTAQAQEALSSAPSAVSLRSVLILPSYDMSAQYGANENVSGPLSGKVFITGEVAADAVHIMHTLLKNEVRLIDHAVVLEPEQGHAAEKVGIAPEEGTRSQRLKEIQQAGRRLGAQAVLCSYIYIFQERIGKDYGIEKPAEVSFELNLVDVASGGIIWKGDFTEQQQSLSDDLFQIGKFIKRKGRWIGAEEMMRHAIQSLLETLDIRSIHQ